MKIESGIVADHPAAPPTGPAALHSSFGALLRDLERDYWAQRPEATLGASASDAAASAAVPEGSMAAAEIDDEELAAPKHQASLQFTSSMHERISMGAREVCSVRPAAPVRPHGAGLSNVFQRYRPVDMQKWCESATPAGAAMLKLRAERFAPVKMHVYQTADGIGANYRDASVGDAPGTALALELRERLRQVHAGLSELHINGRRFEFRRK